MNARAIEAISASRLRPHPTPSDVTRYDLANLLTRGPVLGQPHSRFATLSRFSVRRKCSARSLGVLLPTVAPLFPVREGGFEHSLCRLVQPASPSVGQISPYLVNRLPAAEMHVRRLPSHAVKQPLFVPLAGWGRQFDARTIWGQSPHQPVPVKSHTGILQRFFQQPAHFRGRFRRVRRILLHLSPEAHRVAQLA